MIFDDFRCISVVFRCIFDVFRCIFDVFRCIFDISIFSMSSQDQASPLWIASQEGHVAVVKELLQAGVKVDMPRQVRIQKRKLKCKIENKRTRRSE